MFGHYVAMMSRTFARYMLIMGNTSTCILQQSLKIWSFVQVILDNKPIKRAYVLNAFNNAARWI